MSDLSKPVLDVLAARYRAAFDKAKGGRAQWIEGTLELAAVLLEAKQLLPDTAQFSSWVRRNKLQEINKDDRAALIGLAEDLKAARALLEQTDSYSWQIIWQKSPQRRLRSAKNSQVRHVSRRKRERSIPEVMRDPTLPPPPPRIASLRGVSLTREQVDPDFKGTTLEFASEYGHVLLYTKAQIDERKRQDALQAWLGAVVEFDRAGGAVLAAAEVDPATLREWMSKPGRAEKLRAWCKTVQLACERIGGMADEAAGSG